MIADSTPDSGQKNERHSIAVDESAISPSGWMTLDLTVTRGISVASREGIGVISAKTPPERSPGRPAAGDDDDAVLSLGPREMAAAAMLRAMQSPDHGGKGADAGEAAADPDATRRAWRLAREARALARARGQLPQRPSSPSPMARDDSGNPAVIPNDAIIPVGGSDLQAGTPAQPFPHDDKAANDNRGRMLLITAMLVGICAGYAMTAKSPPTREGYEVPAPLARDVRISHLPQAAQSPRPLAEFSEGV